MNYIELTCKIEPFNQTIREILTAELSQIGFESFVETETKLKSYIQKDLFNIELLDTLNIFSNKSFNISYKIKNIKEQNWNKIWEKEYFQPLQIANKCTIRSSFHNSYPKSKYEIIIDPKMSFGTGHHETTSLMIQEILTLNIENKDVLDMGCGTGVLSILSSMLKAKSILAVDNDKWSFENTSENLKLNKIDNVNTILGDKQKIYNKKFDIILANINKNILLADIPQYALCLKNKGKLLLSGFYSEDFKDIDKLLLDNGLSSKSKKTKNNWMIVSAC